MSHFNFEGQPEGEWDDRGDLSWSESDWQQFLFRQEKEVARFLRLYDESTANNVDRLDQVAKQMGWDAEDWSIADFSDDDLDDLNEPWNEDGDTASEAIDNDPYTIHRHPVFIVSVGLFIQIRYIWRSVLERRRQVIDPLLSWDFSEALSESEKHFLLAMQSMDMGDFLLCIVHMKRSLRGINLAMALMPKAAHLATVPELFRRNVLARLFDLRELSIRIINDCREEEKGTR